MLFSTREMILARIPELVWNPQFMGCICAKYGSRHEGPLPSLFPSPQRSPADAGVGLFPFPLPEGGRHQNGLQVMDEMNENFVGQHSFIHSTILRAFYTSGMVLDAGDKVSNIE